MSGQTEAPAQDTILRDNLVRVFNERDPALRIAALAQLYTPDAVLYEPQNIVTGHDSISATVDALLATLPPGFVFTPVGPEVGHHGLRTLRWNGGPPDAPAIVTGTDVAHIQDNRIIALYVLIDPPANQ